MKYKAIAAHWNGACYSTDGEEWREYETLDQAIADCPYEEYETDADGEPCDADFEWQIYEYDGKDVYSDDATLIQTITVDSQAAERAQQECEIVASRMGDYTTEYVGTDPDGSLVRWTVNGGHRGAHQGDQNRGGRTAMMMPEPVEPIEWLKLAVKLGCDDVDALAAPAELDLEDLEDDADSDIAHWLDAAGQPWTLRCYSLDLGKGVRLAWSDTDEAGIADEQLIDDDEWDGFAERLAGELGEVVDIGRGEHYTTHGVQYQHQAPGNYDEDGYRIDVKRR